ncbi:MAG: RNA-binding S4 domain-containing protein [Proteobacteria bacterium]|nr:RNA-binding S4 domain-containing protein [Pseudomonadota bacterium]HQR04234.1 RNA-binding S4 domain-containing protein [Rhodocyclaceae bacterium]
MEKFFLRGEHIELQALLKALGWVASGGAVREMLSRGEVRVDGEVESRRSRKLREGNEVTRADQTVRIVAASGSNDADVV